MGSLLRYRAPKCVSFLPKNGIFWRFYEIFVKLRSNFGHNLAADPSEQKKKKYDITKSFVTTEFIFLRNFVDKNNA